MWSACRILNLQHTDALPGNALRLKSRSVRALTSGPFTVSATANYFQIETFFNLQPFVILLLYAIRSKQNAKDLATEVRGRANM